MAKQSQFEIEVLKHTLLFVTCFFLSSISLAEHVQDDSTTGETSSRVIDEDYEVRQAKLLETRKTFMENSFSKLNSLHEPDNMDEIKSQLPTLFPNSSPKDLSIITPFPRKAKGKGLTVYNSKLEQYNVLNMDGSITTLPSQPNGWKLAGAHAAQKLKDPTTLKEGPLKTKYLEMYNEGKPFEGSVIAQFYRGSDSKEILLAVGKPTSSGALSWSFTKGSKINSANQVGNLSAYSYAGVGDVVGEYDSFTLFPSKNSRGISFGEEAGTSLNIGSLYSSGLTLEQIPK